MAGQFTGITQVRTVTVPVLDPERALAFYRDLLGFEVRIDAPFGEGQRWVEVAPAGAQTTVALAPPGNGQAGVDTGVRFATVDAAGDREALQGKGADVDAEITNWPGVPPMFSLRDPDGNTLYVVENMQS
jgi:predicted enzyme related to lactoylglutathione lyase